jgi:hypothetical protein
VRSGPLGLGTTTRSIIRRATVLTVELERLEAKFATAGEASSADSWTAWRVFLAALFGLPLGHDQLALFKQFTGRKTAPKSPLREEWAISNGLSVRPPPSLTARPFARSAARQGTR